MSNPTDWNWNQIDAAGRHVLTAGGSIIATLAATHFISGLTPESAGEIAANVDHIWHGTVEVATGVVGLLSALAPIYSALKSASSASPSSQIKSVAATLSEPRTVQDLNAVADPQSRTVLIDAVSKMPEVRGVVAPALADALPQNDKVVATPAEVPPMSKAS
jgi:hypothetical protein